MNTTTLRKQASNLVLAIALATGTAMVAGHILPDEAHAQRKKDRKKKKGKEEEPKQEISQEYMAVYSPLNEAFKGGAEVPPLKPQFDQLVGLTNSSDEKMATGGLVYNAGVRANDLAMRLQGMEMMIESGKVPAESVGQYNFIAYQIAENLKDYAKARRYLISAKDLNYTDGTMAEADMLLMLARNHFSTDEDTKGLEYLQQAIDSRKAAGVKPEEQWYDYAFSVAYNRGLEPQVFNFANARVADYPDNDNWLNAINVVRLLKDYEEQPTLDLLRLARKVGTLNEKRDYLFYVETADARRLPQEVKNVIEEGYASGIVEREDTYISEQLGVASRRIQSDRADLPLLETDALAADATLRTVAAAGAAFLSYGEYDKAETFYNKALTMPGVDEGEALTRLGIAKIGKGDFAAAEATLDKVTGPREPIANLWIAYAREQVAEAAPAPAPAVADAGEATS